MKRWWNKNSPSVLIQCTYLYVRMYSAFHKKPGQRRAVVRWPTVDRRIVDHPTLFRFLWKVPYMQTWYVCTYVEFTLQWLEGVLCSLPPVLHSSLLGVSPGPCSSRVPRSWGWPISGCTSLSSLPSYSPAWGNVLCNSPERKTDLSRDHHAAITYINTYVDENHILHMHVQVLIVTCMMHLVLYWLVKHNICNPCECFGYYRTLMLL